MQITLTFTIKPEELAAIRIQLRDTKFGCSSDVQWAKIFIEEAVQAALVDLIYEDATDEGAVA